MGEIVAGHRRDVRHDGHAALRAALSGDDQHAGRRRSTRWRPRPRWSAPPTSTPIRCRRWAPRTSRSCCRRSPAATSGWAAGADPDTPNLHNPHYDFNDDALQIGASYWVTLAEQQLPVRQAAAGGVATCIPPEHRPGPGQWCGINSTRARSPRLRPVHPERGRAFAGNRAPCRWRRCSASQHPRHSAVAGIRLRFVAQRVVFGGDDQRRRQAGEVLRVKIGETRGSLGRIGRRNRCGNTRPGPRAAPGIRWPASRWTETTA